MNGYQWYPWFSSNLPVTGRHQDSSIFQRSAWYKLKEIKKQHIIVKQHIV